MSHYHFAHPVAFYLLLVVPFVLEEELQARLRRRSTDAARLGVSFATIVSIGELPRSRRQRERPYILSALRIAVITLATLALARPQKIGAETIAFESGRDLVLAVDVSESMRAMDFIIGGKRVDRLTALKTVVRDFIAKRAGDRMGLVVFGDQVFTQSPLTLDHDALIQFIAQLQVGMAGDGTALGDGLVIALRRLNEIPRSRHLKGESRAIVLVTDGFKTAGGTEPAQAAMAAQKLGVKVYAIGVGSNKPAPFPGQDFFGNPILHYEKVDFDEKTLREIAEKTGGRYFNAQNTEELKGIYDDIAKLEERESQTPSIATVQERFMPFMWGAITLLVVYELLCSTRYLRIP